MTKITKFLWPTAAVAIGLFVAITMRNEPPPSAEKLELSPGAARPNTPLREHQALPSIREAAAVSGMVLEVITVPNYTYLRVGEKGSTGTWAAVNAAEISVGQQVAVRDAQLMENFTSNTLNRTFDRIYFGTLNGQGAPTSNTQADPHQGVDRGPSPHPGMGAAVPDLQNVGDGAVNPHLVPAAAGDSVTVGKVDKAKGQDGRTVAEIYGQRDRLAGKTVKVRGVVVKLTANVLDKNFIHLRDGSGTKDKNDFDLTVTTKLTPTVGQTVLFEGVVKPNVDFGSGYRYPVLLENAQTISE